MTSGVTIAKNDQRQFHSLKDELARISRLIDESKKRYEKYQLDKSEEARLTASLVELRKEAHKLADNELAPLQKDVKDAQGQLTKIKTSIKTETKEYERVSELRSNQNVLFVKETERYENVKKQRQDEEMSLISITGESHKTLGDLTKDARDILNTVKGKISAGKKEIQNMETDRKKAKELADANKEADRTLKKNNQTIAKQERILKSKKQQELELDKNLSDKKILFEQDCVRKSALLDEREKDLVKREGKINRVVEWIKNRTGLLKQAKTEIENFRGKILSHIVIPDIDDL